MTRRHRLTAVLQEAPARISDLPRDQLPALAGQLASVQAALAERLERECSQLAEQPSGNGSCAAAPDATRTHLPILELRRFPLLVAVRNLVVICGTWEGNATELLAALSGLVLE